MNRSSTYIKILFFPVAVLLTLSLVHAQEKVDLEKMRPKRVIDKIELLAGPNFIMPNADSWTKFYNTTNGSKYSISGRTGFSAGIGLSHSLSNRWELRSNFFWERRGIDSQGES